MPSRPVVSPGWVSRRRRPVAEFDARGLLLIPGFVDTHVHLMEQADPTRETWAAGSAAAAASGVTTIVEHTHAAPARTAEELREKIAWVDGRSRVDYALAAHAWPDRIDQVAEAWRAGAAFFKVFTCSTHGVPAFRGGPLRLLFREIARVGAIALVHAEDEELVDAAAEELRAAGRSDAGILPVWRNREAELLAVERVLLLAAAENPRIVLAHASQPGVLARVAAARRNGLDIAAESCPQYLTLQEDEVISQAGLRKFTPPARARSRPELDAMWMALAEGAIHHISSDHAPSTLAQKTSGSIWDVPFGLPGIDTTSAILIDAALRGRISVERVADAYSVAPARAYGLPGKAGFRQGADADLVLVDPTASRTLSSVDVRSGAGWTPFEGRQVRGAIAATFVRGEQVYGDDAIGEPTGRFVPGAGWRGDR